MTLEQIREMFNNIAADNIPEPAPFLECVDALLSVADVAQGIAHMERIGGYGHEGIPELCWAIRALEDL